MYILWLSCQKLTLWLTFKVWHYLFWCYVPLKAHSILYLTLCGIPRTDNIKSKLLFYFWGRGNSFSTADFLVNCGPLLAIHEQQVTHAKDRSKGVGEGSFFVCVHLLTFLPSAVFFFTPNKWGRGRPPYAPPLDLPLYATNFKNTNSLHYCLIYKILHWEWIFPKIILNFPFISVVLQQNISWRARWSWVWHLPWTAPLCWQICFLCCVSSLQHEEVLLPKKEETIWMKVYVWTLIAR